MPRTRDVRFPSPPPVDSPALASDASPMPALMPSAADPTPGLFPRGRAAAAFPLFAP